MSLINVTKKKLFRNVFDSVKCRDSFVEQALEELPHDYKLIDCGAGEQKYKKLCGHLNYTSQDFCQFDGNAEAALDIGGKWNTQGIDIVSDIVSIPVENESFDAVLCTEVLEHVKNPYLVIKEFSRILKKGGTLILTAPFASYTHMAPFHYCCGFNKYWYEETLKSNGFSVIKMVENGNYFTELSVDLRRVPQVAEQYNISVGILDKIIIALLALKYGKIKDNGSSEFRCNEYMIVAKKE